MGISQRDSIEFVVNESAFIKLKEKQKHVEILFNVVISASDSSEGELKWVKVNGDEKRRMKAKEYITSLGKPEVELFIAVEQLSSRQLNEWSLADFLFDLEKESSANITVIDDSKVRIAGTAMSVGLVKSYLDGICPISQNYHVNEISEVPVKRARLDSSSTAEIDCHCEDRDDFPRDVEGLLGSLRNDEEENILMSTLGNSDSDIKENVDVCSPLPETPEDFAAKLGYSKDLYALAVKKVGRGADRNDLLNELVKLKNSAKELNDERYDTKDRRRVNSSCPTVNPKQLRPIIIDGSNVAMSHGKQKVFSCRGIALAVEWFRRRGHTSIYVVIPSWRKEAPSEQFPMSDQEILKSLDEAGHLIYTPCRTVAGKRIVCYDDRYIVKVAEEKDGVIVSNDHFRDLQKVKCEWKKVIEERLLMYSFVEDMFMPPDDPNGRHGPTIDELLTVGSGSKTKLCQYGRFCTYGRGCKYAHPERDPQGLGETVLRDTPSNSPRPYSEPVPMTDSLCEDFKRFMSLPNLHGKQSQSIGVYPMHNNALPPALPSRHPSQQLHAPPPPIPPRNNNIIPRGMRTNNENPYAPLPAMPIEQAAQMMQCRRQQPRLPPRQHPDYDTLPFHPRGHIQPHAPHGHYSQYNIPNGVYIGNGNGNGNGNRRRGGPYDNIPPPGGQMPVYPARNHTIYQQNYYRSRAPPADDSDDESQTPPLPVKRRQLSDAETPMEDSELEIVLALSKNDDQPDVDLNQYKCRDTVNREEHNRSIHQNFQENLVYSLRAMNTKFAMDSSFLEKFRLELTIPYDVRKWTTMHRNNSFEYQ